MKPRILAIVNNSYWSIGTIAKLLVRYLSDEFDLLLIPEEILERRPDMLRELLIACDVVFAMNESGAAMLRERAREPLPPLITWIHHVTSWNPEHQIAAEISQVLIALTPGWKEEIARRSPAGARIEVVRNGVDLERFAPQPVHRRDFGIAEGSFAVGFFAARGSDNDAGRKGIDVLLATLRKAAPSIPNLALVVVGPGWENLSAELAGSGVAVHVFGFLPQSHLPRIYSLLDVYLVTSRVEGGPLTVLESMACATPAVATRVGLVPDAIEDGVNGYSVPIGDAEACAAALRAIATDPHRGRMRAAARAGAERHSAAVTYEAFRPIFRDLARRPLRRELRRSPSWVDDTAVTSRVSCAAECLATTVRRFRGGELPAAAAARLLRDMLEGDSLEDCVRAVALLKGLVFRVPGA
jgi:glycosyltransferase involved in cell wall biosynthesis